MYMDYDHLPRTAPESVGIATSQISALLNRFEKNNVEIHNMMIAVDGEIIHSVNYHPYREDIPHMIHSLTKAFTNTAVAKAYSEGLLSLSDHVIDFFKDCEEDYLPENPHENLLEMTIEDLITMRSGHGREISGSEWRPIKTSWIKEFFKEPVPYKPGEYYCYSSANSYMLSAIVQKVIGKTAHQYLRDGFLDKLGFREFSWDVSPEGINSGGNGMSLCIEDIMKLGIVYQQNGQYKGEQLISAKWIDRAFGRVKESQLMDQKVPYNYHWFEYGDLYTASGIFGQNCMIIPKLKMVIGVTAATKNWQDVPKLTNQYFIEPLLKGNQLKTEKRVDDNQFSLMKKVKSVQSAPILPIEEKVYNVIGEHPDNIRNISLRQLHDETIVFTMNDHRGSHSVHNTLDGWHYGVTSITGNYLHHQYQPDQALVVSSAWWSDTHTLRMEWRYPEMAFCDYLSFSFSDDYREVEMNRWVNVNTQDLKREPFHASLRMLK